MLDLIDPTIESTVSIAALDGSNVVGTLFEPRYPIARDIAAIFCCGGGIAAVHYRHFARYLAGNGIPVLTFDFRGIGKSRPARLRRFAASIEDWAEFDCGGAIQWMRARYPTAALVGIAHSIGALLLGAAPNAHECSRFVFLGAHTGYFRDYRRRYQLPMALLWHGVMPAITRLVGYFPARILGLGDDIPSGVALQWAARRTADLHRVPHDRAARARAGLARCYALVGQVLVMNVTDDAFATEAGTRRLLSYFPGLETHKVRISPPDIALRRLGHFGFFRSFARETLWPIVLAYLLRTEQHPQGVSAATCQLVYESRA